MYTIVAGTNRNGSNTLLVAQEYQQFLQQEHIQSTIFNLEEITSLNRDEHFISLEKKYLSAAEKFIFIIPEYNGAFPGVMKLMIDMTDIRTIWNGKKVLMTGIATGRSGNLRGLDTFTNICNYIKLHVLPNKLPISVINQELEFGKFYKPETVQAIREQIKEFISF